MSIKAKAPALIALFALLTPLGCAKQSEPYDKVPQVSLKGAGCLTQAPKAIESFFAGNATAAEISGMWHCFHYALNTFSTYVKGSNKTQFTGEELREFLENYFLQDLKPAPGEKHVIRDQFLAEMMQVKRVFLGGSNTILTKTEVVKTFEVIDSFNSISQDLVPHTKILFRNSAQVAPPSDAADLSLETFGVATRKLMGLLNTDHSGYQFSNLSNLLHEVHLYFHNTNPNSTFADYSLYIPLIAQIKGALMNSDRSGVQASDWVALGPFLSRAYSVYLRAAYYMSGDSLVAAGPLSEIRALMLDMTEVLRQGVLNRKGKPLPLSDIDNVITEAAALKLLPTDVDEDTAKNFLSRLIDFILNPQNAYPKSGVSNEKLDYVEAQIDEWSQVQRALITNSSVPNLPAWAEMADVLNGPWPLRLDTKGRIILDGNSQGQTNIQSNSRMNWARALFHLVFNAYIQDQNRREVTHEMSQVELHTAYLDLKPLLVVFGLVGKDDTTFDKKIYRDAHLFMPRSNGKKVLSFNELIEYVHFVFSGIEAGHLLVNAMDKACYVDAKNVDVNCFRKDFRDKVDIMLDYMPIHLLEDKKMTNGGWKQYIKNLEIINRKEGPISAPMSRTAIYESYVLLQYIEVLMLRFDTDRDGQLDINEGMKLLKLLLGTLASGLGLDEVKDRAELEAIFTYLAHYRELPSTDDPLSAVRYENWKLKRDHWELGLDRAAILEIIGVLTKLGL